MNELTAEPSECEASPSINKPCSRQYPARLVDLSMHRHPSAPYCFFTKKITIDTRSKAGGPHLPRSPGCSDHSRTVTRQCYIWRYRQGRAVNDKTSRNNIAVL